MHEIWGLLAVSIEELYRRLERPCFVGVCGPQGSGKSTGAAKLKVLLGERGLRAAAVSLDDFYLTLAERAHLAQSVHPLLMTRGPPGTHDVPLGVDTTSRLLAGECLPLPSFAKQIDDRIDPASWQCFEGPAQIVILEGWCVGARPQPEEMLIDPLNELECKEDADGLWRSYVNSALWKYQDWFNSIDYIIQLRPPAFSIVAEWRLEQEETLRERLPAGEAAKLMSPEEIRKFIQYYERITIALIEQSEKLADAVAHIDENRRLTALTFPEKACRKLCNL